MKMARVQITKIDNHRRTVRVAPGYIQGCLGEIKRLEQKIACCSNTYHINQYEQRIEVKRTEADSKAEWLRSIAPQHTIELRQEMIDIMHELVARGRVKHDLLEDCYRRGIHECLPPGFDPRVENPSFVDRKIPQA